MKLESSKGMWFGLMYWPYYQGNCCTAHVTQTLYKCKYFSVAIAYTHQVQIITNMVSTKWYNFHGNYKMIFALAYSG